MISVLIVDDEPAVCRLLRHLIRWEELDMTLSGFVYDGQEALELLEEKEAGYCYYRYMYARKERSGADSGITVQGI